jgi:hypothetical protein
MKIEHNGKLYDIERKPDGRLFAGKKFAGFGPGNMNKGFKIVEEVQEDAPIEENS